MRRTCKGAGIETGLRVGQASMPASTRRSISSITATSPSQGDSPMIHRFDHLREAFPGSDGHAVVRRNVRTSQPSTLTAELCAG